VTTCILTTRAIRRWETPWIYRSSEAGRRQRRNNTLRLDQPLVAGLVLVEELERHGEDALGKPFGLQVAKLGAERGQRDDGLRHRAMAAGAADIGEIFPDELAGVARISEVAHRHDERVVDDARDDRPLDVLELQVEVGHVRDDVFPWRVTEKRAEDLLGHPAVLLRPEDVLEPLGRDFRALHLP